MNDLAGLVEPLTGARVTAVRRVTGGDINAAYRVELDRPVEPTGAAVVFVKTHPAPPPGLFTAEAGGLAWLADAGAVRVPRVVAVSDAALVLEWIDPGRDSPTTDERLGRELAALHRAGAAAFGHEHDNYVGLVPQDNRALDTWPEFYATRRIEPLIRRAVDGGRLPVAATDLCARLCARLPDRCGPPEPPARLHGDLWSGNRLTAAASGEPVLIDPAAYGGHREIDLAMMRLFGGFSPVVFAAYGEVFPLAPGHEERVELYQLYPLLVHVVLFGGGYAERALTVMRRLG